MDILIATAITLIHHTVSGKEIWQNIVNPNSNVVAVICGHIHGAYHGTVIAEHGNTVENLLFDSQEDPNGGDGWLRLYKFYPQLNKVSAVTYSPTWKSSTPVPAANLILA